MNIPSGLPLRLPQKNGKPGEMGGNGGAGVGGKRGQMGGKGGGDIGVMGGAQGTTLGEACLCQRFAHNNRKHRGRRGLGGGGVQPSLLAEQSFRRGGCPLPPLHKIL